jgi:hypothetical protein
LGAVDHEFDMAIWQVAVFMTLNFIVTIQACQPENCHGDYFRTFSIALAHSIALVLAVSTAWAHDPRCPQCPKVANN